MARQLNLGAPILLTVLFGLCLGGCSTDDFVETRARGPEDLKIVEVSSLGASVTQTDGTLAVGCPTELLVRVAPEDDDDDEVEELGDFVLAPPGGCGSLTNCGWMVLKLKAESGKIVSGVQSIHTPIAIPIPKANRTGPLTLVLELRDAAGLSVLTDGDEELRREFTVNFDATACSAGTGNSTAAQ